MGLERFIDAQRNAYPQALAEIRAGRKRTHWMWFIFPQLKGLGHSETANYYGIEGINEAQKYLVNPILGSRLIEISEALLQLDHSSASRIFGYPDDLKLHSSMTLFSKVGTDPVFKKVLNKYFSGNPDRRTLQLLEK